MTVTHTPGGPSFRAVATVTLLEDGSAVAHGRGGQTVRLNPLQAEILNRCALRTPASILPGTPDQLNALEDAGLLESDATVLRKCAAMARKEAHPPIRDLGILTCGNPGLLERSVHSWMEYARRHDRTLRMVILDDSPDEHSADMQRKQARSMSGAPGIRLQFADPPARLAIAREIARHADVDVRLVDFAFQGRPSPRVGIGGNRNLLSLLTRGRRVLCADDDIIPRFSAPAPTGAGLAVWINSNDVPMHTYFFDSPAATTACTTLDAETDVFALHESFVGHHVASVVARLSGPASLRDADESLTDALQNTPVPIAATACGLVGDCASDCLGFFSLIAGGDTAERVLARGNPFSPSREVMRRTEFPIICQGVYFITFCHAMDNRLPLPPYFPVGRGEDQVWQKLLHYSLPNSLVAHLPLAVEHRPAGDRRYTPDDYLDPCRIFPGNALLLGLIDSHGVHNGLLPEADSRLAELGRHLGDLARTPQRFAAVVMEAWRAYLHHHRSLVLQSVAERPGYPQWWHRAMAEILRRLDQNYAQPDNVPLEYATLLGEPGIAAMRLDVCKFADLLQVWPAMRASADELADRWAADEAILRP